MDNLKAHLDPSETILFTTENKILIWMIFRTYADYCEAYRPKKLRFGLSAVLRGGESAGQYSVCCG